MILQIALDEIHELESNKRGVHLSLSLRARQGILDAVKIGKTCYSSKRALKKYLSEHGKQRS